VEREVLRRRALPGRAPCRSRGKKQRETREGGEEVVPRGFGRDHCAPASLLRAVSHGREWTKEAKASCQARSSNRDESRGGDQRKARKSKGARNSVFRAPLSSESRNVVEAAGVEPASEGGSSRGHYVRVPPTRALAPGPSNGRDWPSASLSDLARRARH